MRRHLMHEFQHMTEFREATNHLSLCHVEEMLQEVSMSQIGCGGSRLDHVVAPVLCEKRCVIQGRCFLLLRTDGVLKMY